MMPMSPPGMPMQMPQGLPMGGQPDPMMDGGLSQIPPELLAMLLQQLGGQAQPGGNPTDQTMTLLLQLMSMLQQGQGPQPVQGMPASPQVQPNVLPPSLGY